MYNNNHVFLSKYLRVDTITDFTQKVQLGILYRYVYDTSPSTTKVQLNVPSWTSCSLQSNSLKPSSNGRCWKTIIGYYLIHATKIPNVYLIIEVVDTSNSLVKRSKNTFLPSYPNSFMFYRHGKTSTREPMEEIFHECNRYYDTVPQEVLEEFAEYTKLASENKASDRIKILSLHA